MSKGNRVVDNSRKSSNHFELTLAQSDLDKHHVFFAVEGYCDSTVVAEELHADGGKHFHCYLGLREASTIAELRPVMEKSLWGTANGSSLHLSTLRNKAHWVKYITKEDTRPLHKGMDTHLFHQAWRIHDYVANNEEFNPLSPLLRQNPALTNIVERAHAYYWRKQYENRRPETGVYVDRNVPWVAAVIKGLEDGKHIYLHGYAGCGKTTLINELLTHGVTHLPCGLTSFEFSSVSSSSAYILAGDAPEGYLKAHRATILQLCDRGQVSINVKCGPIRQTYFRGQVVIVTNYPPKNEIEWDLALHRRFVQVCANGNAVREKADVKIEIPADIPSEEVIEISDDEEEGA